MPSCILAPPEAQKNHHTDLLFDGPFDQARDLFSYHRSQAPAHEVKLEDADHGRFGLQSSPPRRGCIFLPGGFLRFSDPERISLCVFELQRIDGGEIGIELDKAVPVHQTFNPFRSGDLKMVVTLGADLEVALDDLPVDDLMAGIALDPELFREPQLLPPLPPFPLCLFALLEPGHLR